VYVQLHTYGEKKPLNGWDKILHIIRYLQHS